MQRESLERDRECRAGAARAPGEVPPCGSTNHRFGWQEPLVLKDLTVLEATPTSLLVRANMRYVDGYLDQHDAAAWFFAKVWLTRGAAAAAWRVDAVDYDDDATRAARE